jgi:hypothetical protein
MQQRPDDFTELSADEGADYDEREHIELDELEPLIASRTRRETCAGERGRRDQGGAGLHRQLGKLGLPGPGGRGAVLRDETVDRGLS